MDKKQLWLIVIGLVLLNVITLAMLVLKPAILKEDKVTETVAQIGEKTITRQEWLIELEERYGEETLRDLIDLEVVNQMAEQYGVDVSEEAVDRELNMYKALYAAAGDGPKSEEKWRQQIKYSLQLEELLTKDVKVSEEDLKAFYDDNKSLFDVPAAYHLSQIVVETEKEAQSAVKELEGGSSFDALAMERSIDEFSANHGGDIGFINEADERVDPQFVKAAKALKPGHWSGPVKIENGYGIVFLHEKLAGKKYTYDEVKNQIRRQMALEQMDIPVSARAFWNEARVSWFYGNSEKK